MNNHTMRRRYAALLPASLALLVVWLYTLTAWLDKDKPPPAKPSREVASSAQHICGNATWKLSRDGKTLTCIPRHGKAYTITINP